MFAPLFLGLDLSTQQLKASIIDAKENLVIERAVHFDTDLPHHETVNGAIAGERDGEMTAPVAVFLEAIDVLMEKMKEAGVEFGRILAVSGAAQQHGSVYWNSTAEARLGSLDSSQNLHDQLLPALSLKHAPLWQDSSTTEECRALEGAVGGAQNLADRTGSRAYERFTGPQIKRLYEKEPETYADTTHISLISSFVTSVFLGKIAPIELADASGMNLMKIDSGMWDQELLELCGGPDLRSKLGGEPAVGGTNLGRIAKWWVERFGFNEDCIIAPFTGDNPSSVASLSSPGDAILSLGTSTTLLVSIPSSSTPPAYTTTSHILAHPTTPGGSIAMLCYKNGDLARKAIRDRSYSGDWGQFDQSIQSSSAGNNKYMGFYFPLREIIPDGVTGEYAFQEGKLLGGEGKDFAIANSDAPLPGVSVARAICESQLLSIKSRLSHILPHTGEPLHRCIVTGGASANTTILQLVADILGLPVYVAITSASATVGGALLAQFAWWRTTGRQGTFEEMREEAVGSQLLKKVNDPDQDNKKVYEELLAEYERCEELVVQMSSQ